MPHFMATVAELTAMEVLAALALVVGVYFVVSALIAPVPPVREKRTREEKVPVVDGRTEAVLGPTEAVGQAVIGDMTLDELRAYDGSDPEKPLLMAIRRKVYDVSKSRMHYGAGSPNSMFAGREVGRALALMSFDQDDLTDNIDGLSEDDLEVLQDWECKFMEKYKKVGQIIPG